MRRWFIFGDSHVGAFEAAADQGLLRRPAKFLPVSGATAVGLRNPNSQTDAMQIFSTALLPRKSGFVPVMHLGEVDCGFVIWYRANKYGEAVSAQMDASLDAYFAFAGRLVAAGYPSLVVTGASLPTIPDGYVWGDVANKRREVEASLLDRTNLTLAYNAGIAIGAARRGMLHIDIAADMIDPATGVIADAYRHPDPRNHHLHPMRAGMLWAEALNKLSATDRAAWKLFG